MSLRDWQVAAFQLWEENEYKGVVKVATGGGKTVFALHCANYCLTSNLIEQVVIVVPSLALRDQWYVSLLEEGGFEASQIHMSTTKQPSSESAVVKLAVINTARNIASEMSMGKALLIVDECHRATGKENIRALSGNYICTLGLSATPEGQYDDSFTEHVIPLLGPIIFNYDLLDAIRDGILAKLSIINIKIDLLKHEEAEYNKLTQRIVRLNRGKHPQERAEELKEMLLRKRARLSSLCAMRVPLTVRLVDSYRGRRLIIFHEDVDQANEMLELLRKRGHKATIYHSRISEKVKIDNLRLFRRGIFDVLICCRALDEGVNIPEIEIAIVASSTASDRQRVQRLGRVLRLNQGKDLAEVITLYAVEPEEKRLKEEAVYLQNYSRISWRVVKNSGKTAV